MGRAMQVSDHVDIALDAESTIWRQVSDPAQMPRWSPENTGATVPEERRQCGLVRPSRAPTSAVVPGG